MTLVRTASLLCDADGCDEWFGHDDRPAGMMRADAARAGWSRRAGKDYCSYHNEPAGEGPDDCNATIDGSV